MRDLEMKRLQDVARAQQLEADKAELVLKAETLRQQRRVEMAEAKERDRARQNTEAIRPKTTLEKRIIDRERRQNQYDLQDRLFLCFISDKLSYNCSRHMCCNDT